MSTRAICWKDCPPSASTGVIRKRPVSICSARSSSASQASGSSSGSEMSSQDSAGMSMTAEQAAQSAPSTPNPRDTTPLHSMTWRHCTALASKLLQ